ncbi:conserved hypothetical protein [Trichophyton verrucosum HKI 0517]|uniref:Uncharacterized protein n=1 Tax=Trichophyton verrucosum (strain HKI 0517) TaxID=663202 RepID=D4DFL1_TRIVH|nr:uncharacterized protein TRV_05962 [Trichophyton verrucosum HKI 0517]EFE39369.1 conserved hypothetical protein [Trichophyton verrucosum HKI 0517]
MAGRETRKGSSRARHPQSNGRARVQKGKQRQHSLPFRDHGEPDQQQAGEVAHAFVPGPAYFPPLSDPGCLPGNKPVPGAFGPIRAIPKNHPMEDVNFKTNKPFPDNRQVPPPIRVLRGSELEQIQPANVQGYSWAVAAGYDGPLLPNPALTAMLPKDGHGPENQGIRFFTGEGESSRDTSPSGDELVRLAKVHAYQKRLKPNSIAVPTVKLPRLRGVAVIQLWDKKEDGYIVLPDIRKTVSSLVESLPALSRGFLANHLISTWKDREWHATGVPRPEYPDWTSRTISKCRITNRGHSNGYRSFGDLAQLDFDSVSLENFSILKAGDIPEFKDMSVLQREEFRPEFNIFQHLVRHPELVIIMAKYLRVQELLILNYMSRPFHHVVRNRITGIIISQAQRRAMESAQIFPFRCFGKLCFTDPNKQPHQVPERAEAGEIRQVPSFRWLLMICYREMVCHQIVTIMAEDGLPVPDSCTSVLKKIWLLLDIPDNKRRIALVRQASIFSDLDLFFAMMIFIKIDMRFTDPVTGNGKDGMRRLLLAQPSLTILWRALGRTALVSKLEVMKLYVRWKYHPPHAERGQTIFGIPPDEIGRMQYEAWGKTGSRRILLRPDELIIRESIRRGLNLQLHYTDMFLWGYVNPRTRDNTATEIPPRTLERLEGMEEILMSREERARSRFALVAFPPRA